MHKCINECSDSYINESNNRAQPGWDKIYFLLLVEKIIQQFLLCSQTGDKIKKKKPQMVSVRLKFECKKKH